MKRTFKSLLSLSLALIMAMSLAACGEKTPAATSPDGGTSAGTSGAASTADAGGYPEKTITIVVPFSAGGTTDLAARILADNLPKYLDGATIVVSNITGGSGTIGSTEVADAEPDGYTLGCSAAAAIAVQPLYGQTTYTLDDIMPLCNIYTMPQCIVVSADSPYTTVEEFVDYLKTVDTVNYAHAGRGTVQHLVCAEWMAQVGANAVDLTYAGGPEQATAILSGECEFGALQASDAISYTESGQLKILMNMSDFRPSWMSDVPTTSDLGYTSSVSSCVGLWAPAGLDSAVAEKISAAVEECLKDQDVIAQFANIGIETDFQDGASYKNVLDNTRDAAKKLMTEMGMI